MNVINLNSISLNNGTTFTFNGNANQVFVINVSGDVDLTGGSKIALSGGVTANNIIFNVLGSGHTVSVSNGASAAGTFLDLSGSISLSSSLTGSFLSEQNITLSNGATLNAQPFTPALTAAPEPSTAIVAAIGAGAFLAYGWSRHRRSQVAA